MHVKVINICGSELAEATDSDLESAYALRFLKILADDLEDV